MYIIMYFNIWFFFSILLILLISKNTTTTNYVLCTWSLNNTVWARYIMKCIIRSISLRTELISRHYFRIFLFNNLHSFSQDSAYLSTTYLYSKTKKTLEYEQVKNILNISITFTTIFIHVLDTYMACIFCLISIYILFEMKFCTLWDLSTYITTFSEEVPSFWWKIIPSNRNPISRVQNAAGSTHKFQTYSFFLVHYSTFFKSKTF